MNKFDGKDWTIFVDGEATFGATDGTVNTTADRLPGGNKDDGGFEPAISGDMAGTATVNGLFTLSTVAGKKNAMDIRELQLDKTKITVTWRRTDGMNKTITDYLLAEGYISATTITGARNTVATTSANIQFTGEIETIEESS